MTDKYNEAINEFVNKIFGIMQDQVNALYQHEYHIFTERDTDFIQTFIPDKWGKVAVFEVPGKGDEVFCSAAGHTSDIPPARFSLWLLDSEGKEINGLTVEADMASEKAGHPVLITHADQPTHARQRQLLMKYIHEQPLVRFQATFALTPGQALEWYVCDAERTKDIKKVVFKSEFDIWVKKGTEFNWWDYEKGTMKVK